MWHCHLNTIYISVSAAQEEKGLDLQAIRKGGDGTENILNV